MGRHHTSTTTVPAPLPRRVLTSAVAALVITSGVVACTASLPPAPRTTTVQRTSITSGVAASGSLSALAEVNLGFATGGQLTAVDVKVGDHVTAGQVLATVDDAAARQAVKQAQAQLAAQRAALSGATANPSVGNSQGSLDQAKVVAGRTQDQADAVQQADQVALRNAERQLDQDQSTLHDAQDKLDSDCPDGDPGSGTATPVGSTGAVTVSACTPAVYAADKAAVTAAERTVTADRAARDGASQKIDVDKAAGALAVANAQQGVVTAQNGLNTATAARPSTIAQQQALVANAQAAVTLAQRTLTNTTLKAPIAGTVSVLNGAVGEFVAPSGGTSALAPGSDASIPGASGGSATAAGAGAAAAASPSRPGGTQFLVLDDLNQYQVVLPFTESDAAAVAADQKVRVTFDAVPDLSVTGSVLAVAPTATALSGVISYYVTVSLPQGDPRLRDGMTAHAEVVTTETPDVLAVPSNAVHQQDGTSTVTVLGADGTQHPATVKTGVTGDGLTQVESGLQAGDTIVLPAAP